MCQYCDFLNKTFPLYPTDREILIYRDVFIYLHGGKICKSENEFNEITIKNVDNIVKFNDLTDDEIAQLG
jgi:hypothetical protein